MNDSDSLPTAKACLLCLVVLAAMGSLYMAFSEPFAGTTAAFTGRVLGPTAMISLSLSVVLRGGMRSVALVGACAMAATSLVLVIVG
jgi:hypothetical protein